MEKIKCPNCGEVFTVDESGYAQILQQVKNKEFEKELEKIKERDLELIKVKEKENFDKIIASKEKERQQEIEKKNKELADKDILIEKYKAQLENNENAMKMAVSEIESKKEKERQQEIEKKNKELADKDILIEKYKAQLENNENIMKMAVSEVENKKEKEIINLQNQLTSKKTESELKEKTLKENYELQLKQKDEEIEYYKDFKARQSTKMIGESLEQHCLSQFNNLRMTAFPNAYFEKDNDARTGSKGDFIYRESKDDVEFISIMFEMKNEMDETATKHKNEDFFKELDKDRREKKCEYAILVSMLEADNELYNNGIVDVSYKYEKMYVVRPQFFIPIISLLRNAALNSFEYRQELKIVRDQQIDIKNFEDNMNAFKDGFSRNYQLASKKFKTAIEEIDKTITHLQKVKEELLSSENNLRLANDKAEDLSIKKLTKNAPSVKEMFDELKKE